MTSSSFSLSFSLILSLFPIYRTLLNQLLMSMKIFHIHSLIAGNSHIMWLMCVCVRLTEFSFILIIVYNSFISKFFHRYILVIGISNFFCICVEELKLRKLSAFFFFFLNNVYLRYQKVFYKECYHTLLKCYQNSMKTKKREKRNFFLYHNSCYIQPL